jgi:meso-butanediol dehydrogenase/(S,S)-butanediol dehydrogenase/diacetyl reductase
MVANAGIAPVASFLDMKPELFDTVYSVNVRGVFLCYQAAAREMVKQGTGGRLIGESMRAESAAGLTVSCMLSIWCRCGSSQAPSC